MALPFFYAESLPGQPSQIVLDETNSKHIVQVLRMKEGASLRLTDGLGMMAEGVIVEAHKKACTIQIGSSVVASKQGRKVGIAISPVKNNSRFEWFLEKVTELGVSDIYPLICSRTIRENFRHDRMQAICVSAMLQSQQLWLPVLHEPVAFQQFLEQLSGPARQIQYHQKWIAHCDEMEKHDLVKVLQPEMKDSLIMIGPEGDFSPEEIVAATGKDVAAVMLGDTRLRTETAGMVAATILRLN